MILSLEQNYGATDKQCIYTYILLAEGKKSNYRPDSTTVCPCVYIPVLLFLRGPFLTLDVKSVCNTLSHIMHCSPELLYHPAEIHVKT